MKTRRDFLKSASLAASAAFAGTAGASRFAFGQEAGGKTLIKVFMRGGADGLHLFPAYGDLAYYDHRPSLGIEPPSDSDANTAINMTDTFYTRGYRGLNPNLELLMDIWADGRMMVAPATQIEEANRSHFDCQRWIGNGAANNLIDGYLNRYLQVNSTSDHPMRGITAGKTSLSGELAGEIAIPAIYSADRFNITNNALCSGQGCSENQLLQVLADIASHDVELPPLETKIRETQMVMVESIAEVQAAGTDYTPSAGDLNYTNSSLGQGLKLVAQLLKAGIPLEVAALDWNIGWDTHSNQIPGANVADKFIDQNFRYNRGMTEGANDFLTFYRDMSDYMDDVVVLVGSEFGREVVENGTIGTDHGHGGAWFAFGGPSSPGFGPDVASLAADQIDYGRFLPIVVNYKDMVAELMVRHLGLPESLVSTVLPNHNFVNNNLFTRVA